MGHNPGVFFSALQGLKDIQLTLYEQALSLASAVDLIVSDSLTLIDDITPENNNGGEDDAIEGSNSPLPDLLRPPYGGWGILGQTKQFYESRCLYTGIAAFLGTLLTFSLLSIVVMRRRNRRRVDITKLTNPYASKYRWNPQIIRHSPPKTLRCRAQTNAPVHVPQIDIAARAVNEEGQPKLTISVENSNAAVENNEKGQIFPTTSGRAVSFRQDGTETVGGLEGKKSQSNGSPKKKRVVKRRKRNNDTMSPQRTKSKPCGTRRNGSLPRRRLREIQLKRENSKPTINPDRSRCSHTATLSSSSFHYNKHDFAPVRTTRTLINEAKSSHGCNINKKTSTLSRPAQEQLTNKSGSPRKGKRFSDHGSCNKCSTTLPLFTSSKGRRVSASEGKKMKHSKESPYKLEKRFNSRKSSKPRPVPKKVSEEKKRTRSKSRGKSQNDVSAVNPRKSPGQENIIFPVTLQPCNTYVSNVSDSAAESFISLRKTKSPVLNSLKGEGAFRSYIKETSVFDISNLKKDNASNLQIQDKKVEMGDGYHVELFRGCLDRGEKLFGKISSKECTSAELQREPPKGTEIAFSNPEHSIGDATSNTGRHNTTFLDQKAQSFSNDNSTTFNSSKLGKVTNAFASQPPEYSKGKQRNLIPQSNHGIHIENFRNLSPWRPNMIYEQDKTKLEGGDNQEITPMCFVTDKNYSSAHGNPLNFTFRAKRNDENDRISRMLPPKWNITNSSNFQDRRITERDNAISNNKHFTIPEKGSALTKKVECFWNSSKQQIFKPLCHEEHQEEKNKGFNSSHKSLFSCPKSVPHAKHKESKSNTSHTTPVVHSCWCQDSHFEDGITKATLTYSRPRNGPIQFFQVPVSKLGQTKDLMTGKQKEDFSYFKNVSPNHKMTPEIMDTAKHSDSPVAVVQITNDDVESRRDESESKVKQNQSDVIFRVKRNKITTLYPFRQAQRCQVPKTYTTRKELLMKTSRLHNMAHKNSKMAFNRNKEMDTKDDISGNFPRNTHYDNLSKQPVVNTIKPLTNSNNEHRRVNANGRENDKSIEGKNLSEKFTDSCCGKIAHKCQKDHYNTYRSLHEDFKSNMSRDLKDKSSLCTQDTRLKGPQDNGDGKKCSVDKNHSTALKNDLKYIFGVTKSTGHEHHKKDCTIEKRINLKAELADKRAHETESSNIHHYAIDREKGAEVKRQNAGIKFDRHQSHRVVGESEKNSTYYFGNLTRQEANKAICRLGVKHPRGHHVRLAKNEKCSYPVSHKDVQSGLTSEQINNTNTKFSPKQEERFDSIRADTTDKKQQQKVHNQLTKKSKSIISVRQMLSELTSNSRVKSQTKFHTQEEKIPHSKVCKVIYVKPANRPFKHLKPKQERHLPPQPQPIYFRIPKDVAVCNTLNTSEEQLEKSDSIKYYKLRKFKSHRHQPYKRQNSLTSNFSTSSPSGDQCRYHFRNKNNCSPCRRRLPGLKLKGDKPHCTDMDETDAAPTPQNTDIPPNYFHSRRRTTSLNIADELCPGESKGNKGSQKTSSKRHKSAEVARTSRGRPEKTNERTSDKTADLSNAKKSDGFHNIVTQVETNGKKSPVKSPAIELESRKSRENGLVPKSDNNTVEVKLANDFNDKSSDKGPAKVLHNQNNSELKMSSVKMLSEDKPVRFNIAQHKLSLLKKRFLSFQNRETAKLNLAKKVTSRFNLKCKNYALPTFQNETFQSFENKQTPQSSSVKKNSPPATISHMTQTEESFNAVSVSVQTSPRLSCRPKHTSFLYKRKMCPIIPKLLKEKDFMVRERSMRHRKLPRPSANQSQLQLCNAFPKSDLPVKIKKEPEVSHAACVQATSLGLPKSQGSKTNVLSQSPSMRFAPAVKERESIRQSTTFSQDEGHIDIPSKGSQSFLFEHISQTKDVSLDLSREQVEKVTANNIEDTSIESKATNESEGQVKKFTALAEHFEFNSFQCRGFSESLFKPPLEQKKNEQPPEMATSLQSDYHFMDSFSAIQDTSTSDTSSRQTEHPDEGETSFTSSKLSELRKMCLVRPKWKNANIDEIDRRVKRALRLREQLQMSRSSSGQKSRSVTPNFAMSDRDSQIENVASKSEETAFHLNDLKEESCSQLATPSGATDYKTKPNFETTVQSGDTVSTSEYVPSLNISHDLPLGTQATRPDPSHIETRSKTFNCANARVRVRNNSYGVDQNMSRKPRLERSVSFHEKPVSERENRPERPSSAQTSSRPSNSNSGSNSLKRTRLRDKNSPPTKISKVENTPAKLAGELVQSLPQVPLSSFVEWFIETSDPNNYITSEKSSGSSDKNADTVGPSSQLAESTQDETNRQLFRNQTGKFQQTIKLKQQQQPMTFTRMPKTSTSFDKATSSQTERDQRTLEEEPVAEDRSRNLEKQIYSNRHTKYAVDHASPGDQASIRNQANDRKVASSSLFQKKSRLKAQDHNIHIERKTLKAHGTNVRDAKSYLEFATTTATDYSLSDGNTQTLSIQDRESSTRELCTPLTQLTGYSRPDTASSADTKTGEQTDCTTTKGTPNGRNDDDQTTATPQLDRTWTVTSKEDDEETNPEPEDGKHGTEYSNLFRGIRHNLNITTADNPCHQQRFVNENGQEQSVSGHQHTPDMRRDDCKDMADKYAPGIRHILMKLRHHDDKDNETRVPTTETTTEPSLTTKTVTTNAVGTSRLERMRITLRKSSDVTGIIAKFQKDKTK